ncbi:bZIP transcription factor 53-like [Curcuma longa]|uniref:bZIP transcription factor 53-like n=1 Tax=Curcuma longa TaxID=136217 RepID=UPI003D9EFDDE
MEVRKLELESAMDERKQKRKLSNRESAKRSRIRKQQHLEELLDAAARLRKENGRAVEQVEALSEHHRRMEAENAALRAEASRLTETLRSLDRLAEEATGVDVEAAAKIPGPLLGPWRPPHPAMAAMASTDVPLRVYPSGG